MWDGHCWSWLISIFVSITNWVFNSIHFPIGNIQFSHNHTISPHCAPFTRDLFWEHIFPLNWIRQSDNKGVLLGVHNTHEHTRTHTYYIYMTSITFMLTLICRQSIVIDRFPIPHPQPIEWIIHIFVLFIQLVKDFVELWFLTSICHNTLVYY